MRIAYDLENVNRLIASSQGVTCLEIKSKGISWGCGGREVHSDGGAESAEEPKP